MLTVDENEIYRYLGYGSQMPDEKVRQTVAECLTLLLPEIEYREVHRCFPVSECRKSRSVPGSETFSGGITVLEGIRISSQSLAERLSGCSEICLMAATVGFAPDRLAARASAAGKVSKSVIFQAAGTALIEAWRAEVFDMIRQEAGEKGFCTRPGISPGYGDFPLEHQRDLMQILHVQKTIGVSLTENLMMLPSGTGRQHHQKYGLRTSCGFYPLISVCHHRIAGGRQR